MEHSWPKDADVIISTVISSKKLFWGEKIEIIFHGGKSFDEMIYLEWNVLLCGNVNLWWYDPKDVLDCWYDYCYCWILLKAVFVSHTWFKSLTYFTQCFETY